VNCFENVLNFQFEALTSLHWVPLHARGFGHRCCLVQDALKGEIPEHFDVFSSTMSQEQGYNTRNGYMHLICKPRTEWGRNKTYCKSVTDRASLPTELKKLIPKRIFKYKLIILHLRLLILVLILNLTFRLTFLTFIISIFSDF